MTCLDSGELSRAAQLACIVEAAAEKPGNVTPTQSFDDCSFHHFVASAVAIGPAMADAGDLPVGRTILRAIRDTHALVGTNTNLGIVLLLAPLVRAATGVEEGRELRQSLAGVLRSLTRGDARDAYQAIRLAAPAGMGEVGEQDVTEETPDVTLLEAMGLARDRDAVAREYCTDYSITFDCGVPALRAAWDEGRGLRDSVVRAFLTILSEVPDTLIARKLGGSEAERVSARAADVLALARAGDESFRAGLARLDAELRDPRHRLNPGTTADLVCAAAFVFLVSADVPGGYGAATARW